jgi:hypothetical protein
MNYHGIWPEPIRRQLLDFYARTVTGGGRETAELNAALTAIEETLQRTPGEAGESREGDLRAVIVSPLCVEFVVAQAERRVIVREVHYSRGRRS